LAESRLAALSADKGRWLRLAAGKTREFCPRGKA
jgi:hypothetical protein